MNVTRWIAVSGIAWLAAACGGGAGDGSNGITSGGASSAANGSSSGAAVDTSSSGSGTGNVGVGNPSNGGSSGGSSGANGNSGGASSSSSGAGGVAGGSGGSDVSSDGGAAGDGSAATDPDIAYSVTLTMDSFTVAPGKEVYMCQDFANPFKGQADIKTYELHMATGSHHMFAFYKPNATNGPVVTCPQGGLQFQPFTFTSQRPNDGLTYPEGIGATVPTTTGFTLNVHYINVGTTPITGHVALTMYIAKPGIITQHAGVLFLNQALLSVPATGQPVTSSSTFTLPQDAYVLSSGSHMHQRATNFVAKASSGEMLFQTTQWAEPSAMTYAPPVHLKSGTQITWSCTYVNDTGQTLTFGESAGTNVMCISVSTIYPIPDVNNPVISTQF